MRSKSAVGHQIRVALKRIGTLGIGWEGCKRVTKGAGGERRKRIREKGKERGKVSGSRVISPSQHRPLNSTPLVETKSDTRKAKLLQMHKPFSIRLLSTLSRLYRCFPLRLLTPPFHSKFATPWASFSFSAASFDSCSFQLPTYTHCQSTLFIAKTSFRNPLFLFFFLLVLSSPLPLSLALSLPPFLLSFFFMHCSRMFHFLVSVHFFLFLYIRKSPVPGFFSITLFLIEHRLWHALSWRATARLPAI